MKARIKATGDVVEISLSHIVYDEGKKIMWYNTPQRASFTGDELEFIDTEENFDYWTRLKHQYAGMAMQVVLEKSYNEDYHTNLMASWSKCDAEEVARLSVIYATALVEKLKEKEEGK